jgi:hypothetical protein
VFLIVVDSHAFNDWCKLLSGGIGGLSATHDEVVASMMK